MLFLTIFRRFPTTFRRFPKIFQNRSKGQTNVSEHFRTFSEDCRRRPRKIRRCFDQTPTHLSVVEGTKEKCHIISSHVRISYCFYHFATTRYTTDIYVINRGYYTVARRYEFYVRMATTRYCSCYENIKFISSSHRVMFFLLYGD